VAPRFGASAVASAGGRRGEVRWVRSPGAPTPRISSAHASCRLCGGS